MDVTIYKNGKTQFDKELRNAKQRLFGRIRIELENNLSEKIASGEVHQCKGELTKFRYVQEGKIGVLYPIPFSELENIPFKLSAADLAGVVPAADIAGEMPTTDMAFSWIFDPTFDDCSSFIPIVVTSIGESAFTDCKGLTSIEIPDGVTNIGSQAFWGCSRLASIDIPDSVSSIGEDAFYDCLSLASISLPGHFTNEEIKTFGLPENCRVNKRALMFPVQGTLDKTHLWIGKDNFKPSRYELSNAYCKRLFTAIISNWCLNKAVGTDLVRLPSEGWMNIFYYCRDVYLESSSITASEIVSASDLGVPAKIEEWKERIEEEKTREPMSFARVRSIAK